MESVTPGRANRGQLLLVSAIALAIFLVALAMILSTAIYSESLATGGDTTTDERAAIQYQSAVDRHASESLERVNSANYSTYDSLEANLSQEVATWNDVSARHSAGEGAASAVTITSITDGTRVLQHDADRNFSNRNGESSWQVAQNVTAVRDFRMTVSRDSLHNPGNESCDESGDCFDVIVENGTDTWIASVSRSGNDVVVTVENSSGAVETCSESGTTIAIDFSAGTIADSNCSALQFEQDREEPYSIAFDDADAVAGSYELTADRQFPSVPSLESTPAYEPVIYDVTLDVSYQTAAVTYQTEHRVTPGDSDG